jgi:hypothetical protein
LPRVNAPERSPSSIICRAGGLSPIPRVEPFGPAIDVHMIEFL